MGFRLGCDVGGTFTDFVLYDEASGEYHVDKLLTTPADPSIALPTTSPGPGASPTPPPSSPTR
jgi:N-methylhydantoinase A